MSIWKGVIWAGFGCAMWLCAGCTDDLFGPCDLDTQSLDPKQASCASSKGDAAKTCAIESFLQCDSRVCARYEGSPGYCSQGCQSDGDCDGGGKCRTFNIFSDPPKKYCVPNELL